MNKVGLKRIAYTLAQSKNTPKKILNIHECNKNFLNLYSKRCTQPYVAHKGSGPWIYTTDGREIYDAGGYGMLGFGHNPIKVIRALQKPQVMANIMTPNEEQFHFTRMMDTVISENPYTKYAIANSGSEGTALALRIASTGKGRRAFISLKDGFHGRMDISTRISDSVSSKYDQCIPGMTKEQVCLHVELNSIPDLRAAFDSLHSRGYNICAFIGEPVSGEGNTGATMTREFYQEIRTLCDQYNSKMIIDSVQAGLRCSGELSVVNYPAFKGLSPPDMEIFSKAIHAGQFPVSVLAMNEDSASQFAEGTYGNTMTANPRGLHVMNTVFSMMTPDIKKNIVKQGEVLLEKFEYLQIKYSTMIKSVNGHGLLLGIQLYENALDCIDIERQCRDAGLNVIHAGYNSIRLTPVFTICDDEIDYIISKLDHVFSNNLN